MTKATNSERYVAVILVFTKAFNHISYRRLLVEVKSYSTKTPADLVLLRIQALNVNGTLSRPQLITSEFVQGSVPGTLLLLLCFCVVLS